MTGVGASSLSGNPLANSLADPSDKQNALQAIMSLYNQPQTAAAPDLPPTIPNPNSPPAPAPGMHYDGTALDDPHVLMSQALVSHAKGKDAEANGDITGANVHYATATNLAMQAKEAAQRIAHVQQPAPQAAPNIQAPSATSYPAPLAAGQPGSGDAPVPTESPDDTPPNSDQLAHQAIGAKIAGDEAAKEGDTEKADTLYAQARDFLSKARDAKMQAAQMVSPTPPTGIGDLKRTGIAGLVAALAQSFNRFGNTGDSIMNAYNNNVKARQGAAYNAALANQASQKAQLGVNADYNTAQADQLNSQGDAAVANDAAQARTDATIAGKTAVANIGARAKLLYGDAITQRAYINADGKSRDVLLKSFNDPNSPTRAVDGQMLVDKFGYNISPEQIEAAGKNSTKQNLDVSGANLKDAQTGLTDAKTDAQTTINKYLPQSLMAKIKDLNASANAKTSNAASNATRAQFSTVKGKNGRSEADDVKTALSMMHQQGRMYKSQVDDLNRSIGSPFLTPEQKAPLITKRDGLVSDWNKISEAGTLANNAYKIHAANQLKTRMTAIQNSATGDKAAAAAAAKADYAKAIQDANSP